MTLARQPEEEPSPLRARRALTGGLLLLMAVFIALGSWQMQRLFWKLDLIDRVETRIHAEPAAAPSRGEWPLVNRERDEYRRIEATGTFEHDKAALVQAVTERGAGFWVLTPLRLQDASTVLVNRGFVPSDRRDSAAGMTGTVTVTGLLRISEPGGAFLRSNDPANDRWFSRDVAAIAASRGLNDAAPYFIDADATANPGGLPVGGLTVVAFRNSHLIYALTWYALAVMSVAGLYVVRRPRA